MRRRIVHDVAVPGTVARIILPRERVIVVVRKHPVTIAGPVMLFLLTMLAGSWLWADTGSVLLPILMLIVFGWAGFKVLFWHSHYFVVTSQRLMVTTWLPIGEIAMIPIIKASELKYRRSIPGEIFGYGELSFESIVSQSHTFHRIRHLPMIEELYMTITGLIFPDQS